MNIRTYADNVIIALLPQPTQTASGIQLMAGARTGARDHRKARVLASGPGFRDRHGHLVPNEVKPGDIVIVDALAGQDYSLDLSIPRHNKSSEFQELIGERGEFRIIREQEILAVVESEASAAE